MKKRSQLRFDINIPIYKNSDSNVRCLLIRKLLFHAFIGYMIVILTFITTSISHTNLDIHSANTAQNTYKWSERIRRKKEIASLHGPRLVVRRSLFERYIPRGEIYFRHAHSVFVMLQLNIVATVENRK